MTLLKDIQSGNTQIPDIITNHQKQINKSYDKICFLSSVLLDEIDKLRESTNPMHQFKMHLKGVDKEVNKITKKHYDIIREGATFTDERGLEHSGEDVYHNTAEAYRFIFSRDIQQIIGIAELIREAEKKGIEFEKIEVAYEPLK